MVILLLFFFPLSLFLFSFLILWWECKQVQPLWKTVWRFLKNLGIELTYNPAIPLLGIQTEETRIERDTCTPRFIAALFTIAGAWKQPGCPLADGWIRKFVEYIHSGILLSYIKECIWASSNEVDETLMRWMEPITQSEVNQKEKHQYCILTHVYGI